MPKCRMMGAGLAGSLAYKDNTNGNQGGGNKKQGLAPTTNKAVEFILPAIQNRAYGKNRNLVFCMNQIGGIGAVGSGNRSKTFATTADGVKDCVPTHLKSTKPSLDAFGSTVPPGGGLTSSSGGNVVLPFYVSLQLFSDPDNLPPWNDLNPIFNAQYSIDYGSYNNTNAYGTIEPYTTACFKTPGNSCSDNNVTLCDNLVIGGCNNQSSIPFFPLSRPYNGKLYYDRAGLCWPGGQGLSDANLGGAANPLYTSPKDSFKTHLISFLMSIDAYKAKDYYKDEELGPFTYDNDNEEYPIVQMFCDTHKSASITDFNNISSDYLTDKKTLDDDNGVMASKLYYVDTSETGEDGKYKLKETGILISATVYEYKKSS